MCVGTQTARRAAVRFAFFCFSEDCVKHFHEKYYRAFKWMSLDPVRIPFGPGALPSLGPLVACRTSRGHTRVKASPH